MKTRCYNPNLLIKRPTYTGCTIHEDWINNFQQFAEDYVVMVGYGLPNRHLDKDILYKGNKVYSKNTCVLVPSAINALLTYNRLDKGELPTGITYSTSNKNYAVRCSKNGKREWLGRFYSLDDAILAYKIAKENSIKYMANIYKHELDPRAYDALMKWEILEND